MAIPEDNLKSQHLFFVIFALFFTLLVSNTQAQQAGSTFPQWSPGYLDIHHINTGKGECVFCLLPDGTTLLIDAGATNRTGPRVTDIMPNDSRTPGEWISRYIEHMLAHSTGKMLDYVVLTHFHDDHMGALDVNAPVSKSGKYKLISLTQVGETIPFNKILDRGWPDYNYPAPLVSETMKSYRAFLDEQRSTRNLLVERFIPGRNDQITLVHEPDKYPNFEIRNIAANGAVWTGVDTNTRKHFPPWHDIPERDKPSENMCSIALRLSYGAFDYFNGGDITGVLDEGAPAWQDIETPVARAVGPVDVNELNHHGYLDSENAYFLSALRPRVHIIQAWSPSHPSPRVLRRLLSTRLYPGPRDIFATNMMEANKTVIGGNLEKLKSDQGHIVVRVEPGGSSYNVIILEDSTESYRIKSIHGPYESR